MVLCELAAAFLVLASERTMAVDHFVLRVLQITGTRMRNLAVLCATMAVFCSVLLDTSASVLVVGAVIAAVVRAIQDDAVQGYHQRALFDKATRLLPAMRRRQLENMLWPQRVSHGDDDLPPEMMGAVSLCESPLLSVDMSEGASFGESTEEALWDFIMYNTEFAAKPPRAPKHTPPPQPAYPTRSSLWDPERAQRAAKRTSFLEDGDVVFPGKDSPLPKRGYGNADESLLRVPIASLFAQGMVRDVMFWETRRYTTIFQDLLLCAVNASVIVSYITLYTNEANRYFLEYIRSRYGEEAVSMGTWWSLLAPMMVVSSITYWQNLSNGALHDYNWQVASVVVFFCWLLRRSYPFVYNLREDLIDNFDVLTVDFVMVLVALALPASSSSLLEAPTREYFNLWFRLPWTALLTLGCSGYMAEAVRVSDMVGWLTHWAPRSAQYKFVTQLLLTLGAAVLTELVGRKATVTLMMPVIMDITI
ncbi:hypothetical protein HPB52_022189 [Rhipicephalus sanguineus]|uniref:Uncharacterized protein n=1 Tax=Rhipicephalus sanguineus TaxID=34632 RepID=A0A9D4SUZ3_RHISA|nr:hypothetical protein HPB52_022189 [Rhipicephalus sanguineus]